MKTCNDCGAGTVTRGEWLTLSTEERKAHRARGINRRAGRGLCITCYMRLRHRGPLPPHEPDGVPAEVVAEEWLWLYNSRRTDAYNVAQIAPRLGMTEHALEQALTRLRDQGVVPRPLEHVA